MNLDSLNILLAQAGAPGAQQNPPGMLLIGGYAVILIAIFYFMTIRPQSKKAKEHSAMLNGMKPGDKILTSGGLVGTVVSVKDKTVAIRSAETKLEVLKSAITEITDRSGEAKEITDRSGEAKEITDRSGKTKAIES